jgi:hypothetical protein
VVGRFVNDELGTIWKKPAMVCFKIRCEALTAAKVNKSSRAINRVNWLKIGGVSGIVPSICLEKLKRTTKRLRIVCLGARFELRTT